MECNELPNYAADEDGMTTEDGTCCGACQQVLRDYQEKKLQEKKPRMPKKQYRQGRFGVMWRNMAHSE